MKLRSVQDLFVRAMILPAALWVPHSLTYSQEPQTSAPPAQAPAAQPAPAPLPDFWHGETMTGDWGGTRSHWKEKGVELEFMLTQFGQGVAAGGIRQGSVYNGKVQTVFKFDFGKLAGWKYWSAEVRTETRFGGPLLGESERSAPSIRRSLFPRLPERSSQLPR